MANDTPNKQFSLTFPDLIRISNDIHNYMERDTTEFTGYGITNTVIAAFETQINDFEEFPTDEELQATSTQATKNKNDVRGELQGMLASFETRAKLTFGINTALYNLFYMKNISQSNDNDLLVFGRKVARTAEQYKIQLAGAGVTQAMIDDLTDKCQEFEDSFDAMGTAVAARDNGTVTRNNMGNELYANLVKYADVGKTIWNNVNPANYNDYVIYNNPVNDRPGKIRNFRYDTDRFEWDANAKAEMYEIQYKRTDSGSGEWTTLNIIPQTNYGYAKQIGTYQFRVRGTNYAGDGDWGDVLEFDIPVPPAVSDLVATHYLPTPTTPNNVRLNWTRPDGIGSFQIFRAAQNGTYNNPLPGTFTQIDTVGDPTYEDVTFLPLNKNMLYYYVLNMDTNGDPLSGGQSNVAFVDLNAPV